MIKVTKHIWNLGCLVDPYLRICADVDRIRPNQSLTEPTGPLLRGVRQDRNHLRHRLHLGSLEDRKTNGGVFAVRVGPGHAATEDRDGADGRTVCPRSSGRKGTLPGTGIHILRLID